MADVEQARGRRIQHAHETNALNYGHLGTATYDDQLHRWTFLRQNRVRSQARRNEEDEVDLAPAHRHGLLSASSVTCDHGPVLQPAHPSVYSGSAFRLVHGRTLRETELGNGETLPPNEAVEGSATIVDSKGLFQKQSSGTGKNTFLKQIPDAAIAIRSLCTTALSSDPLFEDDTIKQPPRNILAFGNARIAIDHEVRSDRVRPIAALAAGPGGERLRLVGLDTCDVSVRESSGLEVSYRVPAIGYQLAGSWTASAEPILHVSASPNRHRVQFIVVKSSGTSILRPLVMDKVRQAPIVLQDSNDLGHTTRSQLEPGLVVTIPSSRTGGNPHAHSAFNPQDQTSLAVVDTCGTWSIWKLRGTRSRSARVLYRAQLQCSNDMGHPVDVPHSPQTRQHYDGWHRVCWLQGEQGFADRILVCNRRSAVVFDLAGKRVSSVDMRLGPISEGNQILDVQNSDRRRDHILVLTTSRLLIFSSSEVSWKDRPGVEPLALVCSWNHFRTRDDLSLRMSLCELTQVTCVLVYSRTSHFTLVYHFGNDDTSQNTVSWKDPSVFEMPHQLQALMHQVIDIVICPTNLHAAPRGHSSSQADDDFLKLTACLSDGTIVEAVYNHSLGHPPSGSSENSSNHIWRLSLPGTTAHHVQSAKYVDEDETDDFVVDDDMIEEQVIRDRHDRSQTDIARSHAPRLRSWEQLLDYEFLRGSAQASQPFEDVLEEATHRIQAMAMENKIDQLHVLSDILGVFQLTDVDQDSETVRSWLNELGNSIDVSVESAGLQLGVLPGTSQDNLVGLYDELTACYIEGLPSIVTDRSRVSREKLVRQAAADAFASNVVLKIGIPKPAERIADDQVSSPPLESDQEGGFSSSQPSVSQSPQPQEEPAVAGLRRYAGFSEVVPPLQLSHNPNISAILAHLPESIEEDPAQYSYRHVTQRLKLAQEEMATQSLDPRERRKAARHAARLQKRLEKTAKMSQEAIMQRTLLPGITSLGHGVALPGREVQSSQVAVPESSQLQAGIPGLSMTQPERGAFGTRPAKGKLKGKGKRTAGF